MRVLSLFERVIENCSISRELSQICAQNVAHEHLSIYPHGYQLNPRRHLLYYNWIFYNCIYTVTIIHTVMRLREREKI